MLNQQQHLLPQQKPTGRKAKKQVRFCLDLEIELLFLFFSFFFLADFGDFGFFVGFVLLLKSIWVTLTAVIAVYFIIQR